MARHLFITEKREIPGGDHTVPLLILRLMERREEQVPGVLWIHGGGYQSGSAKEVFATRALSLVVKFGAVLLAPDYRLSRKHPYPAGLEDCYAVLLYMKDHAAELGIRSDQLMVGGESAGGGMAAALCMLAHDRGEVNIAFQMPLYPMLDDRDTPSSRDNHAPVWNTRRNHRAWRRYLREAYGTDAVPCYAAPARREDHEGLPPCYTFVGRSSPSAARRRTMSAACGRRAWTRTSTSTPAGSTPTTSTARGRRSSGRPSAASRTTIGTPPGIISPPRTTEPGTRKTPADTLGGGSLLYFFRRAQRSKAGRQGRASRKSKVRSSQAPIRPMSQPFTAAQRIVPSFTPSKRPKPKKRKESRMPTRQLTQS